MLRVVTVGAGYFAAFHHDAWRRHPQTELVGIVDADPEKAPDFPSLTAALEAAPDIIDIATPPPSHAALVREALAAGPRAIICQKPFTTSADEAKALAEDADAAGIPLIVHENIRFQPWYRRMKEIMGTLGDIHQLTFRLRPGDGQGPEAYLDRQPYFQTMPRLLVQETAVHWIDTFQFLLGPIEGVYADLRHLNPAVAGEDAGHIIFSFAEGRRAIFDGDRHLDHDTDDPRLTFGEALLEGTEGTIALTGDGTLLRRAFGAREARVVFPPNAWPGFAGDCVYALQAHVVSALLGHGSFENEARDYVTVREIEEAIYRSHAEKRWVAT
ncbi:MAG: Gfo/Idh/MocA family oxidoreductase [Pseudomonadota bacterium]